MSDQYILLAIILLVGLSLVNTIIGSSRKIGAAKSFIFSLFPSLLIGMLAEGEARLSRYGVAPINFAIYLLSPVLTMIVVLASQRKKKYWEH